MDIIIYTKHGCKKCEALKGFLKRMNLLFAEKDIDTDEVVEELLNSSYVIENFCDEDECIVKTPIVKVDGNWMHQEFFDLEGFNEKKSKEIFKV